VLEWWCSEQGGGGGDTPKARSRRARLMGFLRVLGERGTRRRVGCGKQRLRLTVVRHGRRTKRRPRWQGCHPTGAAEPRKEGRRFVRTHARGKRPAARSKRGLSPERGSFATRRAWEQDATEKRAPSTRRGTASVTGWSLVQLCHRLNLFRLPGRRRSGEAGSFSC
jgi:hypothetical protein